MRNLAEKWKILDYYYEANDVKLGIKKFNNKWKKTIKNEWEVEIVNNLLG